MCLVGHFDWCFGCRLIVIGFVLVLFGWVWFRFFLSHVCVLPFVTFVCWLLRLMPVGSFVVVVVCFGVVLLNKRRGGEGNPPNKVRKRKAQTNYNRLTFWRRKRIGLGMKEERV
ncbi:MAG: hypothetical protein ACTS42_01330 [Candidatus Hodgkinia cicadicola]